MHPRACRLLSGRRVLPKSKLLRKLRGPTSVFSLIGLQAASRVLQAATSSVDQTVARAVLGSVQGFEKEMASTDHHAVTGRIASSSF